MEFGSVVYFRGSDVAVNVGSCDVHSVHSSMMSSGRDSSQVTCIIQSHRRSSLALIVMGENSPRTSNTFPKVGAIERLDTLLGISDGVVMWRVSVATFQCIPSVIKVCSGVVNWRSSILINSGGMEDLNLASFVLHLRLAKWRSSHN